MDLTGKSCPVCSKEFKENDDIVVCPKCGAPYHRDCYSQTGKCIFTELHKSKKTWKEMQAEENKKEEETENSAETVKCPSCGAENPKNAIICKSCGKFLSKDISFSDSTGSTGQNNGVGGVPFSVFLDPMGGVPQDEDFDGVSGAELSQYIQVNTSYYLPVFSRMKRLQKNRFNFCAFLFTGGWYLYRKQYVKGAITALVYVLLEIGMMLASSLFAVPLMNEASEYFGKTTYVSGMEYINWVYNNKSAGDVFLMLLPEVLLIAMITMRIVCGLRGNRSYYKCAVAKIKRIKQAEMPAESTENSVSEKETEEKTGDESLEAPRLPQQLSQKLKEAGGVNKAVAWMCFACYLILSFAPMFIK